MNIYVANIPWKASEDQLKAKLRSVAVALVSLR